MLKISVFCLSCRHCFRILPVKPKIAILNSFSRKTLFPTRFAMTEIYLHLPVFITNIYYDINFTFYFFLRIQFS